MHVELIVKSIISIITIAIVAIPAKIFTSYAKHIQIKHKIQKSRYYTIRRIISIISTMLILMLLISTWGINIKNLWVTMTSIFAMISVAFVASWSIIANILAGFILFFTSPFRVNDTIEILPDNIKGKVLAINAFYTLLSDEDDNLLNVPNSQFFNTYIKKYKNKKGEPHAA